mmetsp:Transcript_27872/g.95085  ORF Transcript_27872/g.95085 Transcript_27872/m.95085 type:complete len:542 (-) Transcript_27872:813-2438(-)
MAGSSRARGGAHVDDHSNTDTSVPFLDPHVLARASGSPLLPPDFLADFAGKYLHRGYKMLLYNGISLVFLPLIFAAVAEINLQSEHIADLFHTVRETHLELSLATLLGCVLGVVLGVVMVLFTRDRPVYMLDFALYRPPDERSTIPFEKFERMTRACADYTPESADFQCRMASKSGLGDNTYLPPAILDPANSGEPSIRTAREEAAEVMFTAVEGVFRKTGIKPNQVDIVIVNCSLFCPTPSLTSMVVNHFKMRSNVLTYNLGGMGCSAGLISIDLAKDLLQVHRRATALVVSTENITQNWYRGNDRSMLLPNALFRVGGAAILLTNKRRCWWTAKYRLQHTVRTHKGADDASYRAVFQEEDAQGTAGVRLDRCLVDRAGAALKANITVLGPLVLPYYEQVIFLVTMLLRRLPALRKRIPTYVPDFAQAVDHFCVHTGGKTVVEETGKTLRLSDNMLQPSRAALERFGNTSSSSVWYILGYAESEGRVNRGDVVWQIGFGSGFKVNSAVWVAMRRIKDVHPAWADFPTVHRKHSAQQSGAV